MRQAEILTINAQGSEAIRAMGYIPHSGEQTGVIYDDLTIDLRNAPPFIFTFPDGYRANSKTINRKMLEAHSVPVVEKKNLTSGTWREPDNLGWYVGRHWFAMFLIGNDGHAESLMLGACGQKKSQVLGTSDGSQFFDFPLSQVDMEQLFGLSAQTEQQFAMTGLSCL